MNVGSYEEKAVLTTSNRTRAEAWNGYEGAHWAAHADRYDAVNSGFNEPLLAAVEIGEHERVLDVGCGNGQLTRLAGTRARFGRVLGVDLSAPMLGVARTRASAQDHVAFEQGDAQVHPFPAGGFDVALSRFGVMFFADPVAAFTNIHRALRPGGRLAFVCLGEPCGTDLGALLGALGPSPSLRAGNGPASFSDPARVTTVLGDAGFHSITCTHVEAEQLWGRDVPDAADFLFGWGPVRHWLQAGGPQAAARNRDSMVTALSAFAHPDGVRLRGTAWLVRASA
jgi:SAM-dependent methyltransferase